MSRVPPVVGRPPSDSRQVPDEVPVLDGIPRELMFRLVDIMGMDSLKIVFCPFSRFRANFAFDIVPGELMVHELGIFGDERCELVVVKFFSYKTFVYMLDLVSRQ